MDTMTFQAAASGGGWDWGWDAVAALATLAATLTVLVVPALERRRTRRTVVAAAMPAIGDEFAHIVKLTRSLVIAIESRMRFNDKCNADLARLPADVVREIDPRNPLLNDPIEPPPWKANLGTVRDLMVHNRVKVELPTDYVQQIFDLDLPVCRGLEPSLIAVQAPQVGALIGTRAEIQRKRDDFRNAYGAWDPTTFRNEELSDIFDVCIAIGVLAEKTVMVTKYVERVTR